jgi:serine/threonine protein kinase/WD40 repeat protein
MRNAKADAKKLFLEALDLQGTDARRRFLDRACATDADLRGRVEKLLRAHQDAGNFLGKPDPVELTCDAAGPERPGTVIGPYKLLEQIGEGGMGVVFMAEQIKPVRRKVALKVLKPGMDTRQVVARFEAERQALALMDHPNIAHVLDGGETAAGHPYFVMELVRGIPITDFCDENHFPVRERLKLFVSVCQAVQHAHQKGIIHRDLKPSNVMVTLHDGEPVVKVIDFGIAKAMGQQLTDKTLFTNYAVMIGTPIYMSPEQAEMSGLDVDTRTDIYALGVLLYELLTGMTPCDKKLLRSAGFDEIRRVIREDEPPRPSARVSTLGQEAASVSARRKSDPKRLSQLFRGELDWIVLKALDKDRKRRYETASAFAADVQRYLHDEPVLACPPSAWYRLRKNMHRHRGAALAAMLVVLALVAGMIGTTWGLIRATDAKAVAVYEANEKAQALQDREDALAAARQSEREKSVQLWEALLAQARANRLSRRPGQRFETLGILRRALEMARMLDLSAEKFGELRDAVIAALALPDLYLAGPWHPWPADAYGLDLDEGHALYARTDRKGACTICQVADDHQIHSLPPLGAAALPRLSRDGKYVALLDDRDSKTGVGVHVWKIDEATPRRILLEEKAESLDFHPNGTQAALTYAGGAIGLFELPSGRRIKRLLPACPLASEMVCALHPTESVVAICSYFSPVVQLRDLRTGAVLAVLRQTSRPHSVAWHPTGRILAVGMAEACQVHLYDRATLKPFRTLECGRTASYLAFNPLGDRLAISGWGKAVDLFDVGTGQKLFAALNCAGVPRFSHDGRRLASSIQDGKWGIWQVGDGREYRTLQRKAMPANSLFLIPPTVHPDGRLAVAAMSDGFGFWDLASGSELGFVPGDGDNLRALFQPSGALLILGPTGLSRWNVKSDAGAKGRYIIGPPERLPLPTGHCLGQSRDGRVIVTCSRTVGAELPHAGGWILHADRPDRPIRLDAGQDIQWIAVSPDGRLVITVTHYAGLAKLWDARSGKLLRQLADGGAGFPSFTPDGRWFTMETDGNRLFAADTLRPGRRLGGRASFAANGTLMAVDTNSHVFRLVDSAKDNTLARLEEPDGNGLYYPVFTRDGSRLISCSQGKFKGILTWDLRLIRRELTEMGLDWDAPPYPPADPQEESMPIQVLGIGGFSRQTGH